MISSSSSSSSSFLNIFIISPLPSPSPFSPSNNFHHHQVPKAKTMEEVWKDINLASLHDHPSERDFSSSTPPALHNPHRSNPNFILQDFLARPSIKDPPTRIVSACRGDTRGAICASPLPSAPATVLSLNTGPTSFGFVHSSDPLRTSSHLQSRHYPVSNISSSLNFPYEALDASLGLPSFERKRMQDSDGSTGDRRHKRMIKNRESAARSRARKQAYTNELELEVAHLLEENARLRREQEELQTAAAVQLPKKHTLQRTSTAPF